MENKIRPGCYTEFKTAGTTGLEVKDRGVVTFPLVTNWGLDNELISITTEDILNGTFKNKLGDTDTLLFELGLYGAKSVLVYVINKGDKAEAELNSKIKGVAKHGGVFGNKITFGLKDGTLIIDADGETKENFLVSKYKDVLEVESDYIDFELVTGVNGDDAITETDSFIVLSGGANTTITTRNKITYDDYFKKLKSKTFNVIACVDEKFNNAVIEFVKDMRDNDQIKIQGVVNDTTPNYEGIIKLKNQKLKLKNLTILPNEVTVYVAGVTAGATVTKSNTNQETPFTEIVNDLTSKEIEQAIKDGFFVFSYRADKTVKIEYDINSFTSFTVSKNSDFSKNKIIRTIDEINNTIKIDLETSFIGKVNNNDNGRTVLKALILGYLNTLQTLEAIEDLTPTDIVITKTNERNSIIVDLYIKPVDAIEKIYFRITLT